MHKSEGAPKPPKFTAQELMDLHGLTVEQALAKGYEVVGYSKVGELIDSNIGKHEGNGGHEAVYDDEAHRKNRECVRRYRARKKAEKKPPGSGNSVGGKRK